MGTLAPGASQTVDITFNSTGLAQGDHTTLNIVSNDPDEGVVPVQLSVALAGDADRDCDVDIIDLVLVAKSFNTARGDPGYDPNADFNRDGIIDIFDLVVVGINFGKTC